MVGRSSSQVDRREFDLRVGDVVGDAVGDKMDVVIRRV
jgi:hypothetical protein